MRSDLVIAGVLLAASCTFVGRGERSGARDQDRAASTVPTATQNPVEVPATPAIELEFPKDLFVQIKRTKCLGSCPVAVTTLSSAGRVEFEGERHTRVAGHRQSDVDPSVVQSVWRELAAAEFFALADSYAKRIRDVPAVVFTVRANGITKRVRVDSIPWGVKIELNEADFIRTHDILEALALTIESQVGTRGLIEE